MAVETFDGGSALHYWRARDRTLLDLGPGSHPAADSRHLYWATTGRITRLCLDALEAL